MVREGGATGQPLKKRAGALGDLVGSWLAHAPASISQRRRNPIPHDARALLTACRLLEEWSRKILSPAAGWLLAPETSSIAAAFLAGHCIARLEFWPWPYPDPQAPACGRPPARARRVSSLATGFHEDFSPQEWQSCTTKCSPRRVSRLPQICFVDSCNRPL